MPAVIAATTAAAALALAIVTQDGSALRAAPSGSAATHAQLMAGELLEVRGTRLDYLQAYDHRIERAGYVRASQVRRIGEAEADAPELLAVLRFVRDTPGAEALGIAYTAAYLRAAPAAQITAEPFDALGVMAERLARRAGSKSPGNATQQLDVVAPYGVRFFSYERNGTLQLCYDGEAFRRVASMAGATPAQRARAALALTRHDCVDPALPAHERTALDRWRANLLDSLGPTDTAQLDELTKNRLRLRRAGVWAAIAFGQSRRAEAPQAAAQRAIDELAAVRPADLGDDDQGDHSEAAIRVGAVRWAAAPLPATAAVAGRPRIALQPGEPGQTCVLLQLAAATPVQRCTYGTVWAASAQPSPDGRALTLSVQPLEGWTELWVFHAAADGPWRIDVLPPASADPGLGYIEFAGWTAGPQRRLLVAREHRLDGRSTRRFEVLSPDTLTAEKWASTPQLLAAFGASADARWRRETVSVR